MTPKKRVANLQAALRRARRAAWGPYGECSMDVPSIDKWVCADKRITIDDTPNRLVSVEVYCSFYFRSRDEMRDATMFLADNAVR